MKITRCFFFLIAICSIELHADLLCETKKVLDFFDQTIEKTLPSNSDEYKKHEALKKSLRLNIIIDELRACFSALYCKLEASAASTKDVFLHNIQKSMRQVLHRQVHQEYSMMAMELSTLFLHGVSLNDFLRPFELMEARDLKLKIKSLLQQILSIFLNSQDARDFYNSIGMDSRLSEVVILLQAISSER